MDPRKAFAKQSIRRSGCAIAAWVGFIFFCIFLIFFFAKVYTYVRKIRSGDLVELPQYASRLTRGAGSAATTTVANVDIATLQDTNSPILGNAKAPLTIVLFSEFECPFSRETSTMVRTVMAKYGDRVRLIYRDFPLESIHPSAMQASVAAECARAQGKFWPFYDKLFANQEAIKYADLLRYATETGLDSTAFSQCLASNKYKSNVQKDLEVGRQVGVQGTPTFFFNGEKVEGSIPENVLEQLIQRLTKQ